MPEATTEQKIIRQVEYYFSDINLSKDKFLQEEIQKDAGWVPLNILTTFKRLKDLSSDSQVIIDSLKKSTSNLLEIDEENKKVRRTKALPDDLAEFEMTSKKNTVYVKGFPESLNLDELYSFFEKFGKVLNIYMRRIPSTKTFKGSVFVTFETNEQVTDFMAKEEVKYEDVVLNRETQEAYFVRKGPEFEKKRNAKKDKEQEKEEKKKQLLEAEEAFLKEQKVPNAVLHLKGFNSEASRESIKEIFDNHSAVRWIDYVRGQPEGFIRFVEANSAKPTLEKVLEEGNGTLKIKDAIIEARVVEGEEEEEYWKDVLKQMRESRMSKNKHHGNRGNKSNRGGRGGRDYKNKRSRDDEDNNENEKNGDGVKNENETSVKKIKTESEPQAVKAEKTGAAESPAKPAIIDQKPPQTTTA
jgi:lupus La protein